MSKKFNRLIKDALKNLKKEFYLIDMILLSEENEDSLTCETLKDAFKEISKKTDLLIKTMVNNYSQDQLDESILDIDDMVSQDNFDRMTLYSLVANYYEIVSDKSKTNINTVYEENDNMLLYSLYLDYIKEHDLTKEELDSLHSYVVLRICQYLSLRKLFANDEKEALRISTPSEYIGDYDIIYSYKYYYELLNDTIKACNNLGAITAEEKLKESVEGRRKLFVIEFEALCLNLMSRGIVYPEIDEEISSFTEGVIKEASSLAEKKKNNKTKKLEIL